MNRSSLVVPLIVLCLFAVLLPVRIPLPASGLSNEDCFTLADAAPAARPGGLSLLERCSALYPDDVVLLSDLAAAYEAAGAPERAEAAYRRALAIDPGFAQLRLRLGQLLLRRGAAADARREAAAALLIQPNRQALLDLLLASDEALAGAPR